MPELIRIELDSVDLGQLLDGLNARADAWEKTAHYHRTGESPPDFIVEECCDAKEADAVAAHYRSIIGKIQSQQAQQS